MKNSIRIITRIALFSALIYVLSWGTAALPNVNFAFFITFFAGVIWGFVPGLLVGMIGMWLWTTFNPYGPATLPVMLAQVIGMGSCGVLGAICRKLDPYKKSHNTQLFLAVTAGIACTIIFYTPVSLVDAWIFQPFWARFYTGLWYMLISVIANAIIFPIFWLASKRIYDQESHLVW